MPGACVKRRVMGMLFRLGALFTGLTVSDNVALPLREHASPPPRTNRFTAPVVSGDPEGSPGGAGC